MTKRRFVARPVEYSVGRFGSSVWVVWPSTTAVDLDLRVEYNLTAFATNTGWHSPWINPDDAAEFHFSAPLIITGTDLAEGTTFIIAKPDAPADRR